MSKVNPSLIGASSFHQQACLLLAKSEVFGPGTLTLYWLIDTHSLTLLEINHYALRICSHEVCETICTQSVRVVEKRQFEELGTKKRGVGWGRVLVITAD